ncbi:uncharacterized protein LOC122882640 [Siniperca chuatsi]|uniref:uncharacterized protein LOC122882640 n=1 Tax=Siniperca chuatsi TaxID=119488 RepID=UPI001CE04ACC|nr:uncharacterized protein LOC122882640 [Siniperca chuatsi]
MESLKTALGHFAKHISKTAGVHAVVIVIFSYHVVLDKDLACTCKEQLDACWLYMTLPAFLIFVLMLWVDKTFQRAWKYTCGNCKNNFCCVVVYHILKAAFVGLLWAASVLIDGDWYVCCYNDFSGQHTLLACKEKTNITAEERGIIAELINKSRVVGLPLLICITFAAAFMSSLPRNKCCTDDKSNCRKIDEIILEEGENLVTKTVREAVKHKLMEKLDTCVTNEEWAKCFDVAEELITEKSYGPPAESSPSGPATESSPCGPPAESSPSGPAAESSPSSQPAEFSSSK